jgi:hypothetical protein
MRRATKSTVASRLQVTVASLWERSLIYPPHFVTSSASRTFSQHIQFHINVLAVKGYPWRRVTVCQCYMPFAPAQTSPAHQALDKLGASDAGTTARNIYEAIVRCRATTSDGPVINSITGHLYYQPTIINFGSANIGDLGEMCKSLRFPIFRRWSKASSGVESGLDASHPSPLTTKSIARDNRRQSKEETRAYTPPSSDTATSDLAHKHMLSDPADPGEYRIRQADWFIPGRMFRIWGEQDVEIHKKMFVLLDTKNVEGPGLLMHIYGDEEEQTAGMGYFLRTHVLVQNFENFRDFDSQKKEKVVYMDEYEENRVGEHTYIELEHQYNIPFEKYPCIDCGVLGPPSLKHLRRCYLKWLHYHWDIA